ncbi:hypothetical protein SGMN_12520 [Stenotrophomonas geniculata]
MGEGSHAMDGGGGVAMDLQAELLGELLGGVGGSIHGGSLTCDAIAVMRGGSAANGGAPRGWQSQARGLGRTGGAREGRRKYVHVALVAASMRLTPSQAPPIRPPTAWRECQPRKNRKDQKRSARFRQPF